MSRQWGFALPRRHSSGWGRVVTGLGTNHGVQEPLIRHAFERVGTLVFELQPASGNEILDSRGNEDLGGFGQRRNPSANVHRDPENVIAGELDFSRVTSGSYFEAQRAHRICNGLGAAHRPRRPIEGCKYSIAGRLDEAAPIPHHFLLRCLMVLGEQISPAGIAKFRRFGGRSDNVGEEYRREDTVGLPGRLLDTEEASDFVHV